MSRRNGCRARRSSGTLAGVCLAALACCQLGSASVARQLLETVQPAVQMAAGATTQAPTEAPALPDLTGLASLPSLPFFGLPPLPAVELSTTPQAAPAMSPLSDAMATAVAAPTPAVVAVQPLVDEGALAPSASRAEAVPQIPAPTDLPLAPAPDVINLQLPAANLALSPVAAVLADIVNGPAPAVHDVALPPVSIPITERVVPLPPVPPPVVQPVMVQAQPVQADTSADTTDDGPPVPPLPPRPRPLPRPGFNSYLKVASPMMAPMMAPNTAPAAMGSPSRHLLQEGPPEPPVDFMAQPPMPPMAMPESGPQEPPRPEAFTFAPAGAELPVGLPMPPLISFAEMAQMDYPVTNSHGRKMLATKAPAMAPAAQPVSLAAAQPTGPQGPPEINPQAVSFLQSAAKTVFDNLLQPYVGAGRRLAEAPAQIPALSPMVMPEAMAGPPQPQQPGPNGPGPMAPQPQPGMQPQPGPQLNAAQSPEPPLPALPPAVVAFFQTSTNSIISKLAETINGRRKLAEDGPMSPSFYVASPVMAPAVAAEIAPLSPMPVAQPMAGPPQPAGPGGPQQNMAGPPQPGFASQPQTAPMPQQPPPIAIPPSVVSFFQTASSAIMSNLANTLNGRKLLEEPLGAQMVKAVAMDGPPQGPIGPQPVATNAQPLSEQTRDYIAPAIAALAPAGAELVTEAQASGRPEAPPLPRGPGMAPQPGQLPALPPAVNSFISTATSALLSNFASSFQTLGRKLLQDSSEGPPRLPLAPQPLLDADQNGERPPLPPIPEPFRAENLPPLPPGTQHGNAPVVETAEAPQPQPASQPLGAPQQPAQPPALSPAFTNVATFAALAPAPQPPQPVGIEIPEPPMPAGPESLPGPPQPAQPAEAPQPQQPPQPAEAPQPPQPVQPAEAPQPPQPVPLAGPPQPQEPVPLAGPPQPQEPPQPVPLAGPPQPQEPPQPPEPNAAGPPQPAPLPEAPAVGPQPLGEQPQQNFGPQGPLQLPAAPPAIENLAGQVNNFLQQSFGKTVDSAVQNLLG